MNTTLLRYAELLEVFGVQDHVSRPSFVLIILPRPFRDGRPLIRA